MKRVFCDKCGIEDSRDRNDFPANPIEQVVYNGNSYDLCSDCWGKYNEILERHKAQMLTWLGGNNAINKEG